jgi:AcrR family transcriptional regulator
MAEARWERWVRAPRQERARVTFERVLNAAAEVLAEQGYEGFAVAEVCRRAAVAPGTLYDRVEDRSALFLAVHDRELQRLTVNLEEALTILASRTRLSTRRLLDEVVNLLVSQYAEERALLRTFILRAAVDPRVRDEGKHYVDRLEAATVAVMLTRQRDFRVNDAERAVRTAYRLVVDSLSWRTAFGADFHGGQMSDEAWAGELREVVRRRLLG